MWHLTWICTVCLRLFYGFPGKNELNECVLPDFLCPKKMRHTTYKYMYVDFVYEPRFGHFHDEIIGKMSKNCKFGEKNKLKLNIEPAYLIFLKPVK